MTLTAGNGELGKNEAKNRFSARYGKTKPISETASGEHPAKLKAELRPSSTLRASPCSCSPQPYPGPESLPCPWVPQGKAKMGSAWAGHTPLLWVHRGSSNSKPT